MQRQNALSRTQNTPKRSDGKNNSSTSLGVIKETENSVYGTQSMKLKGRKFAGRPSVHIIFKQITRATGYSKRYIILG